MFSTGPRDRPGTQTGAALLIDRIASPQDLKQLSEAQLHVLADELRQVVIRGVASNGGHLGPNLGVVELTIALHRVFTSPHDVILWDTGHQAYIHKLLTGRLGQFGSLRQPGGLSGYPSRLESEHDWIENSHASTALSYAHGLAGAFELQDLDRRVVAVIGDGAMTGGMSYEALNNIGHSGRRALIVLNDNGRSYAPTIGRLSQSVSRLRLHPTYRRADSGLQRAADGVESWKPTLVEGIKRAKRAVREVVEPRQFFELLGLRYVGPFDGHDLTLMEEVLQRASESDMPTVVHVMTQKGRGYAPAEQDPEKRLHETSPFDLGTGPTKDRSVKWTHVFSEELVRLGKDHPELVAITAAMPGSTGLLPFADEFGDRCIDVGIAEQHAMTMAAGLAMGGARPLLALYSTFMSRAFDQLHFDVALHGQPLILTLDRAGITGDDGASHHGLLDLGLCVRVPGMTVLAPSSAPDLQAMMRTAMTIDGPVSIRFPKGNVDPEHGIAGEGVRARLVRDGSQICILSVGRLLSAAETAAVELAEHGLSASVWDVRCAKPLDDDMLAAAAEHQMVVTAEDGLRIGGAGEYIADRLRERGSNATVVCLGAPDTFIPQGKPAQILAELGLDAAGIAASTRKSWEEHHG